MDITDTSMVLDRIIKSIPKYKDPFIYKDMNLGHPFCLETTVRLFGKEILPNTLGIYHLFYKGNLVYIGMSQNLRGRLLYHLRDPHKIFDGILIFKAGDDFTLEDILTIEANMIKEYTPSLNIGYIKNN